MSPKKQANVTKAEQKRGMNDAEKGLNEEIIHLERLAKEVLRTAKNPAATGMRIANRIHRLADTLEKMVKSEDVASTEADVIGMGIGVF